MRLVTRTLIKSSNRIRKMTSTNSSSTVLQHRCLINSSVIVMHQVIAWRKPWEQPSPHSNCNWTNQAVKIRKHNSYSTVIVLTPCLWETKINRRQTRKVVQVNKFCQRKRNLRFKTKKLSLECSWSRISIKTITILSSLYKNNNWKRKWPIERKYKQFFDRKYI